MTLSRSSLIRFDTIATKTSKLLIRPQSSSSSPTSSLRSKPPVVPTSPIFSRREKRKLRVSYPRPDVSPKVLCPSPTPMFVNRVTMADGSVFHLTTSSPRPSISLVRDLSNHPLWNPSLEREVADEDQSGRMGRFARRYGRSKKEQLVQEKEVEEELVSTIAKEARAKAGTDSEVRRDETRNLESSQIESKRVANKASIEEQGFGTDDLDWISGDSINSFYGVGDAKNVKGLKKPAKAPNPKK
ncbi:hypothetical protein PPACK8108_LOCUS25874 [Phakopsora pachyrhizi]|uniref:Ribosomal protein bL31m N-terminal domain-containing protein n=1 Tax=Phakopsora pachyrhizi TaxID=170000 RepID=A0AAV0BW88_PHAPC|nr:hypothetical protein PPACK8108_LOCUS17940 [Phakopsora pachyrhizi]CAH7690506.1 hypothetical protein PPACK8108_LOCUS25874 [Phakopsora pachyrhizi]